ncbi:MAG: hypothetical protein R2705_06810 [Ilumatobacteraceae bacterium]
MLPIDEVDRADDEAPGGVPPRTARRVLGDDPGVGNDPGRTPADRGADLQPDPRSPRRLKRRCLYHWIEFPSVDETVRIIRAQLWRRHHARRAGRGGDAASAQPRGPEAAPIAEAIGWVNALELLGLGALDGERAPRRRSVWC